MRYGAFEPDDESSDRGTRSRKRIPQALVFAAALTMSTSLGLWIFYSGAAVGHTNTDDLAPTDTATAAILARAEAMPVNLPPAVRPLNFDVAMLEPVATMNPPPSDYQASEAEAAAPVIPQAATPQASTPQAATPETASPRTVEAPQAAPAPEVAQAEETIVPNLPAAPSVVKDVPMPMRRPAFLRSAETEPDTSSPRAAQPVTASAEPAAPAAPAQPSFFDKLFGKARMPGTALAYANPEDGIGGQSDGGTAVYAIANHTVYLPDGSRLEAHSGLGQNLDDPASVRTRMRGATPPALYDLTLRESLFHGVQALRLTPVNESDTYGRGGLLAHTFMLGPRGDSNGCVVFRNYQAFLQAYQAGKIRRLRVVSSL